MLILIKVKSQIRIRNKGKRETLIRIIVIRIRNSARVVIKQLFKALFRQKNHDSKYKKILLKFVNQKEIR